MSIHPLYADESAVSGKSPDDETLIEPQIKKKGFYSAKMPQTTKRKRKKMALHAVLTARIHKQTKVVSS